jgi:hypothetical protein
MERRNVVPSGEYMGASLRLTRSLRNVIGRRGFELGSGYVAVDYSVRMKHCIY